MARQKIQAGFAALYGIHNVAFILQDAGQRLANAGLIVDNQDGKARHAEF
jgi:hypothetical protein